MALVHYLYVGHFVPEMGYVKCNGHSFVTERPIDTEAVAALLKNKDAFPAEWGMSLLENYIVCDYYGAPPDALQFVADYAEQQGATIVDLGSFTLVAPARLRETVAHLRPRPHARQGFAG